ncbi:MAG: thiamine phosphate synthase [Sedimentisphaerales bacterium]|nr:thiamine phosphate synthase [Sedimentisphaerales bacterium]
MEKTVYRIIDANFNRSREAARLMEEYCRFALNCEHLSSRAKQIRHKLCSCADKLGIEKLISARDAAGDVGKDAKVQGQLKRTDLRTAFIAASKRITEALRVLAETVAPIDASISDTFERLRFDAYTLEKDVLFFSDTSARFAGVKLYVLINADVNTSSEDIISLVKACSSGGADCIQLRAKSLPDKKMQKLAADLVKTCGDEGLISIINDRIDIAIAADADGVHLGQDDLSVETARFLQSKPLIIGVSTHSVEQLTLAIKSRPTYVALGPVFATPTKPDIEIAGIEYVKKSIKILGDQGIPYVAIGGITINNIKQVLSEGVKAVAVCSAVTDDPEPANACKALSSIINANS